MDNYQRFIHVSRYARYIPELKRRENWDETVTRLTDFIRKHQPALGKDIDRIHDAVLKLEVMPSMRLLMTAGEACERDNISAYNCSYLAMNNKRAFSECLYILMNQEKRGRNLHANSIKSEKIQQRFFKQISMIKMN